MNFKLHIPLCTEEQKFCYISNLYNNFGKTGIFQMLNLPIYEYTITLCFIRNFFIDLKSILLIPFS